MTAQTTREQWEALIVEPSVWRRVRDAGAMGRGVVFDAEDQENLEADLQNEFRRIAQNVEPQRLHSVDHPLARFYRLMYTDEFEDFRRNVLRESVTGKGVVEMSIGVREMLMDQTFRYFVFVEENPVTAIRFGQLIVAVAVFRNTYDDDSRKLIEGGILKSRRRLYKTLTSTVSQRYFGGQDVTAYEYVDLASYGVPAKYEASIATAVVKSMKDKSGIVDVLPLGYYGNFPTDDLTFTSPLNVNTSVYSPARKFALHCMHLLTKLVSDQPLAEGVKIVYVGNADPDMLRLVRDLIPSSVTLVQGIEKITNNGYTIIILDEENDLEASAGVGDDSKFMQQVTMTLSIKNNFRQNPERLLGVSMFIRAPSVLSGSGSFEFLPGDVYQTAWKNPQDERMRLVWSPDRFSTDLIEYSLRSYVSARKFQDYVVRPLFRFSPNSLPETANPNGLVAGEFDSELEKLIVGMYYRKFPPGRKTWAEAVDLETDILVAPRFIKGESYVENKEFLSRYHSSIVKIHLDTPKNPLLPHVAKVMRGGLFPTVNLGKTPLVESVEMVFGTKSADLAAQSLETFLRVESDQRNVIVTLKEKNVFPREADKTIMVALLRDLTKNFREIAAYEPFMTHRQDNYIYPLTVGLERGDAVNVVQLGDSFGNILYDVYMQLDQLRVRAETVFFEGTFPFNQLWKYITREEPPNFVWAKNVYELKEPLEKSGLPIILIRGYGYPVEIFNAFVRAWSASRLFRGFVEVGEDGKIVSTPSTLLSSPKDMFDQVVADKVQNMVLGAGKSCLFIGSDYESSLSFLSKPTFTRAFHLVESASGARRVTEMSSVSRRNLLTKVFVRDNMTRNFVLPVEDDRYDYIFCNPVIFTRLTKDVSSATKFFSEISKAMRPDSTFQVVLLNKLVGYAEDSGQGLEGYGKLLTNKFFNLEVLDESFELNGVQGFKISLWALRNVYSQYALGFRYVDTDYGRQFDAEEESGEGEEETEEELEERRPSSPSRDAPARRGEFDSFPLSKLRRMLPVIEFVKERGGEREIEEPFEAYEGQAVDVGAKVRKYNNLVKRSMISRVLKRQRVLDLACGHGQDMNKWFSDEAVETYIGMDASEAAIEEADRRFKSRKGFKPRNTKFVTRDLFGAQDWVFDAQMSARGRVYDIVSCQLAIHYAFSDERTIKRFLYNVSSLLAVGGEFIVSTIDDQTIRSMVNSQAKGRSAAMVLRGEHYILDLEPETVDRLLTKNVMPAGVSYKFTQFPSDPMSRTTTEYVVDHDYFRALAEEMGLKLTSSANFLQDEAGENISEERNELTFEEREIAAFYKTYTFRKVAEPRETQASVAAAFKFTDSKQQFLSTVHISEAAMASNITAFKRGLFLSPEMGFPGTYVASGYESMQVYTESINSVRFIANQLQSKGRLTEKELIVISPPRETELFDMIFVPHSQAANPEAYVDRLVEGGSIYGAYVTMERVDELIEPGESTFSNSIFDITVSRRRGVFSINKRLDVSSSRLTNLDSIREMAGRRDLRVEIIPALASQPSMNIAAKQYLGLFGMYKLTKETPVVAPPALVPEVQQLPKKRTPKPKKRVEEEEPAGPAEEPQPQGPAPEEETVDRFVLLPGLVQKKAPGKGKDESLSAASEKGLYKDLARDTRWRFKLSDEWESEEFMIRMPSGETFTSVRNAMVYYKCVFSGEEDEGYRGLNRSTGLPQPEDLKPYTKAIRGKRGTQWKEEEAKILRSVYEAKFTNTPNVSNDNPENLSPLRALLMTKNAQLFSNSKTRNELLEMTRRLLQRIVVA